MVVSRANGVLCALLRPADNGGRDAEPVGPDAAPAPLSEI